MYVPTLVDEVLRGNNAGQTPRLSLKVGCPFLHSHMLQQPGMRGDCSCMQGYLIGNGVTDPEFDGNALAPFARGKALISHALFGDLMSACNGSFWDAQTGVRLFSLEGPTLLAD